MVEVDLVGATVDQDVINQFDVRQNAYRLKSDVAESIYNRLYVLKATPWRDEPLRPRDSSAMGTRW